MTTTTEDTAAYVAENLESIQAAASAGSKEAKHLLDVRLGCKNAERALFHWQCELSAAVYQYKNGGKQDEQEM